jgi:hypothetical protein
MSGSLRSYDHNADNPPWLKALAEVRIQATREGWCHAHVQTIIVAIDQYAEAALGNRSYFSISRMALGAVGATTFRDWQRLNCRLLVDQSIAVEVG